VYRLVTYPEAADQIAEHPAHLLPYYAAVMDELKTQPWAAPSHNSNNPGGAVRRRLFGPLGSGQVLYLVLERDREVHVLSVVWFELPET
jgi:hypothetical protein